jgi:hypothetical protein
MKIKSAAIKDKKTGIVYTGINHAAIAFDPDAPLYEINETCKNLLCDYFGIQGFVTDTDVFVDRKEAAKIALACGQIKKLRYFKDQLDSADINYPEKLIK